MRAYRFLMTCVLLVLVLTACASSRDTVPPTPTRTPKPTFTPTPTVQAFVPNPAAPSAPVQPAPAVIPPTPTPVPPTPTPVPPTPTPTPKPVAVVNTDRLNVRAGPGTAHPRIGLIRRGERYEILAQNPQRTWWQIRLNDGSVGWVYGELVNTEGNVAAVQIAQNIPTPPPTPTPRPRPTPTPIPPTPTPAPTTPYVYVRGSMQVAPNCGTVYMEGIVVDQGGNPINGVTVELSFFDNRVYRVTGVGKPAGAFGFSPLSQEFYHKPVPFNLRIVQSESNPTPLSDDLFIDFQNCNQAGQFTNITFKKVR